MGLQRILRVCFAAFLGLVCFDLGQAGAAPTSVHSECISCHKGRQDTDGENAVNVWQSSWHGKSSDDLIPAKLKDPRRKATMEKILAANPGKKTFLTDERCGSCHLQKLGATLGVVCESCHGPGSDYKVPHQTKETGYQASLGKGLKNLRDLKERAEDCYGCHLSAGAVKVRGFKESMLAEIISQGHPPMEKWDFAKEVQDPKIFHWARQKARAGGEPQAALDAAGKAVLATIPALSIKGATTAAAAPPPAAPPTQPPAAAAPPAAEPTPVPAAVAQASVPDKPPAAQVQPAGPKPTPRPKRPADAPAAGTSAAGSTAAVAPPPEPPPPPPPTPVPVQPTPTPFPGPESIDRLTSSEAALLLHSYAIEVLNRAVAEKPAESLPAAPDTRISSIVEGTSRDERLLRLQREVLQLQGQILGAGAPPTTPTPPPPAPAEPAAPAPASGGSR